MLAAAIALLGPLIGPSQNTGRASAGSALGLASGHATLWRKCRFFSSPSPRVWLRNEHLPDEPLVASTMCPAVPQARDPVVDVLHAVDVDARHVVDRQRVQPLQHAVPAALLDERGRVRLVDGVREQQRHDVGQRLDARDAGVVGAARAAAGSARGVRRTAPARRAIAARRCRRPAGRTPCPDRRSSRATVGESVSWPVALKGGSGARRSAALRPRACRRGNAQATAMQAAAQAVMKPNASA